MLLGRVKEQLWLSHASPTWSGHRLVGVVLRKADGRDGGEVVAVDTIGARVGELVLVASSSKVRNLVIGDGGPVKTVILAVVDKADRARLSWSSVLKRSARDDKG